MHCSKAGILLCATLLLSATGSLLAQRPGPLTPGILRVCADPDNLPNSNQAGEGFENKLAELLARTWDSKLEYVWWAAPRGLFSRALNGRYCDVIIAAPARLDIAAVTAPYFRTGYVMVYRKDRGLDLASLDDPALKRLKIGVHMLNSDGENTPPAMALSSHGVVGNLVAFGTVYTGEQDRPDEIIRAVLDGRIDVAMVWGPLAGYFVRQAGDTLVMVPMADDSLSGIPFTFAMGMATRRREPELKDSLQKFLNDKAIEIRSILEAYGLPLLPLAGDTANRIGLGTPSPQ